MAGADTVIFEEEFAKINAVCDRLRGEANALVVFIVDKNGQLISASGETEHLDTTSLASLTAGNVAATGGIAKLLKEKEFATQFHEGEKANIHIQIVGQRVILVVIFDTRSSLGLVRLRVRKASEELNKVFDSLVEKAKKPGAMSVLEEITDEDIENLFNE
ncbi:MAG: roadblock/LC7 domain-containing protein [Deltaproteobacteria bacterium]|nr:roadblock/LC7 domain-containing protein [Deltaproteobacteria bacterium]